MAEEIIDDPLADVPLDVSEPTIEARGVFVHGQNLRQKELHKSKYFDQQSRDHLCEIRERYNIWKADNFALEGPRLEPDNSDLEIIGNRVQLVEQYKNFIDQQKYAEQFDSRSNLHSSVLEEFIYYLFRDLVSSFPGRPLIGKSSTFKDLFFAPGSYEQMITIPYAKIERKNHDFVIGSTINASFVVDGAESTETHVFDLPAVAIECKTYLDKTMLEGSSVAAEQLKMRNPNALYILVAEWLKLTEDINLKKYKVDQIYILRKQKNTDREFRFKDNYSKKPLDTNVVLKLYDQVREHLTGGWGGGVQEGLDRGWLI